MTLQNLRDGPGNTKAMARCAALMGGEGVTRAISEKTESLVYSFAGNTSR